MIPFWQQYKIPIILAGVSFILIASSITILIKSFQSSIPIEFSSSSGQASLSASQQTLITVDIEGAVVKPGVYQLSSGSRVEEILRLAGGLAPGADVERIAQTINRAARLVDGGKLYFPFTGDPLSSGSTRGSSSQAFSGASVNTATQSELEALSGIGPVTAKKIIDNRPYQTLEELISRKVMGQSLFDKLKEQLTL